ncbi:MULTISPECIES: hypothetical protein [unclassified Bradyrhizobium]|uniref:DUF7946 domain-containing protein n=1 Tax=unclassified Bradyrhizobium TaxID=2631580 RepID=UPI002915E9C5|nr:MULTISPECIES: hypothetical protein [unclassified Bradyrhizobium]
MSQDVRFALTFSGAAANSNLIEFYDVADALTGFQRSLALTIHLVLNGEIIVQAPSLKGATIYLRAPEQGSWKALAVVSMIATGAHVIGTAPRDTIIGHLAISAYDYVISESLGFHVDFNKTLGQQYEELQSGRRKKLPVPPPSQSKMDALIEKCEPSIREMHRPIYASHSASKAVVEYSFKREAKRSRSLTIETFEYIDVTTLDDVPNLLVGKVSSYNMNTFKGRIFTETEKRPVPFVLHESARSSENIGRITRSLDSNAMGRLDGAADVRISAFRNTSVTGRLKNLVVSEVLPI